MTTVQIVTVMQSGKREVGQTAGRLPRKTRSPHIERRASCCVFFLRERRYAELSYLLPVYLRPTVKNPVCRPFLLARQLLIAYRGFIRLTMHQTGELLEFLKNGLPQTRTPNPANGFFRFSFPTVVGSPWPERRIVSSGRVNSFERIPKTSWR